MDLTWKEAYNVMGKNRKYPLAKMGKMTMNAGNDAMEQWAKRAIYQFEENERADEESTTDEDSMTDGNTGACAKRKRECGGCDEGELSRPSKRTLPPSPSMSSDVAVEHVPDSGTRRMRVDLPRPAASAPAI
ncbi:unnamed protein product, partial [Ascophyllum nodosum]